MTKNLKTTLSKPDAALPVDPADLVTGGSAPSVEAPPLKRTTEGLQPELVAPILPKERAATSIPQKPSIGRVVHYVMEFGSRAGEHRPAIIIDHFREGSVPVTDERVQLVVFVDRYNDGIPDGPNSFANVLSRSAIVHDEKGRNLGTWHWPEFVP